jgi:hypothetical protein
VVMQTCFENELTVGSASRSLTLDPRTDRPTSMAFTPPGVIVSRWLGAARGAVIAARLASGYGSLARCRS